MSSVPSSVEAALEARRKSEEQRLSRKKRMIETYKDSFPNPYQKAVYKFENKDPYSNAVWKFENRNVYNDAVWKFEHPNEYKNNLQYHTEPRGTLDRVFGFLGYGGIVEGLYNLTDDDKSTTFGQGLIEGIKHQNPFEDDVTKRNTFSDVLENLGWEDNEDGSPNILRSIAGFTGDVLLDPLTYINPFGAGSKVVKGTGITLKDAKQVKNMAKVNRLSSKIDDASNVSSKIDKLTDITLDDAKKVVKNANPHYTPEEIESEAIKALDRYAEKVKGLRDSNQGYGLSFGLAHAIPFSEKIKVGDKTLDIFTKTFISADKLRSFGDKTIAPYYNSLAKRIRSSKLAGGFSKKSQILRKSVIDGDKVAFDMFYNDILFKSFGKASASIEDFSNAEYIQKWFDENPNYTYDDFIKDHEDGVFKKTLEYEKLRASALKDSIKRNDYKNKPSAKLSKIQSEIKDKEDKIAKLEVFIDNAYTHAKNEVNKVNYTNASEIIKSRRKPKDSLDYYSEIPTSFEGRYRFSDYEMPSTSSNTNGLTQVESKFDKSNPPSIDDYENIITSIEDAKKQIDEISKEIPNVIEELKNYPVESQEYANTVSRLSDLKDKGMSAIKYLRRNPSEKLSIDEKKFLELDEQLESLFKEARVDSKIYRKQASRGKEFNPPDIDAEDVAPILEDGIVDINKIYGDIASKSGLDKFVDKLENMDVNIYSGSGRIDIKDKRKVAEYINSCLCKYFGIKDVTKQLNYFRMELSELIKNTEPDVAKLNKRVIILKKNIQNLESKLIVDVLRLKDDDFLELYADLACQDWEAFFKNLQKSSNFYIDEDNIPHLRNLNNEQYYQEKRKNIFPSVNNLYLKGTGSTFKEYPVNYLDEHYYLVEDIFKRHKDDFPRLFGKGFSSFSNLNSSQKRTALTIFELLDFVDENGVGMREIMKHSDMQEIIRRNDSQTYDKLVAPIVHQNFLNIRLDLVNYLTKGESNLSEESAEIIKKCYDSLKDYLFDMPHEDIIHVLRKTRDGIYKESAEFADKYVNEEIISKGKSLAYDLNINSMKPVVQKLISIRYGNIIRKEVYFEDIEKFNTRAGSYSLDKSLRRENNITNNFYNELNNISKKVYDKIFIKTYKIPREKLPNYILFKYTHDGLINDSAYVYPLEYALNINSITRCQPRDETFFLLPSGKVVHIVPKFYVEPPKASYTASVLGDFIREYRIKKVIKPKTFKELEDMASLREVEEMQRVMPDVYKLPNGRYAYVIPPNRGLTYFYGKKIFDYPTPLPKKNINLLPSGNKNYIETDIDTFLSKNIDEDIPDASQASRPLTDVVYRFYELNSEIEKIRNKLISTEENRLAKIEDNVIKKANEARTNKINAETERIAELEAERDEILNYISSEYKSRIDSAIDMENTSINTRSNIDNAFSEILPLQKHNLYADSIESTLKEVDEFSGLFDSRSIGEIKLKEFLTEEKSIKTINNLTDEINVLKEEANQVALEDYELFVDKELFEKLKTTNETFERIKNLSEKEGLLEIHKMFADRMAKAIKSEMISTGNFDKRKMAIYEALKNNYVPKIKNFDFEADEYVKTMYHETGKFNPSVHGKKRTFDYTRNNTKLLEAEEKWYKTVINLELTRLKKEGVDSAEIEKLLSTISRDDVVSMYKHNIADIYLERAIGSNELIYSNNVNNFIKNVLCTKYTGIQTSDFVVAHYIELEEILKNNYNSLFKVKGIRKPKFTFKEYKSKFFDVLGIDEKYVGMNSPYFPVDPKKIELGKKFIGYINLSDNFKSLKLYNMDDYVYDTVNKFTKEQNDSMKNGFLKLFDTLQVQWKLLNTVINPGFHIQNAVSNAFQSFLAIGSDAFNPSKLKKAYAIINTKDPKQFVTLNGKKYSYKEFANIVEKYKVIDNSFFKEEMSSEGYSFVLYRLGTKVGSNIEAVQRVNIFASLVDQGKTFEEAAEGVDKFLFDYGELTEFEKTTMKRILPFYTFMRKNIPLMLEQMIEQPQVFSNTNKAITNFEKMNENYIDENYRNEFRQDYIQLPFGLSDGDGNEVQYGVANQLPYSQLDRMFDPQKLLGQISPLIKTPIELLTGKNIYTGMPTGGLLNYAAQQIPATKIPVNAINTKDAGTERNLYILGQMAGFPINQIKPMTYYEDYGDYWEDLNNSFFDSIFNKANQEDMPVR